MVLIVSVGSVISIWKVVPVSIGTSKPIELVTGETTIGDSTVESQGSVTVTVKMSV